MTFVLVTDDKGLDATITTTTSMDSAFPITQLNRKYITAVTRTASTVLTLVIKMNLEAGATFDYWALVNHNLQAGSTARLQVYTTDARTVEVYDSTVLSVPTMTNDLYYWSNGWDCPAQTDLYVTITLTKPSGDYVWIGAVYLGTRFVPDSNMDRNVQFLIDDPFTKQLDADEGYSGYVPSQRQRSVALTLSLQQNSVGQEWLKILYRMGTHEWVFFQFDEDNINEGMQTFLATMQKLSPLRYPYANRKAFNANIVEQL